LSLSFGSSRSEQGVAADHGCAKPDQKVKLRDDFVISSRTA